MNSNRQIAVELFSKALKESLIAYYGYLPSAAKFADAFNLRAHGTSTVSRETTRKWLRGIAIPEIDRLKVLVSWLGIKPLSFLDLGPISLEGSVDLVERDGRIDTEGARVILSGILKDLDKEALEILLLTAWALREVKVGNRKAIAFFNH